MSNNISQPARPPQPGNLPPADWPVNLLMQALFHNALTELKDVSDKLNQAYAKIVEAMGKEDNASHTEPSFPKNT
jgi:hypothetical protein